MIIGLWVLSLVLMFIVITLVGLVVLTDSDDYNTLASIGIIVIATILVGIDITICTTPEAMDVYQGKTTLEYTIVDGEKVDSVVIWKQ